jgi:hypothetical protein
LAFVVENSGSGEPANFASDPNPRLAGGGDRDRCPVACDDVVVEANIVGVWRTPIGWAVYGAAVARGGGYGSVRRTGR